MAGVIGLIVAALISPLLFWLATRRNAQRPLLLVVAILHLLASLAVPVLFGYAVGFGKLYILDVFVELDQGGVIDYAKLQKLRGGRSVDEWEIPEDLEDHFTVVSHLALGVSIFCFSTSVGLLGVWWRLRPLPPSRQQSTGSLNGVNGVRSPLDDR